MPASTRAKERGNVPLRSGIERLYECTIERGAEQPREAPRGKASRNFHPPTCAAAVVLSALVLERMWFAAGSLWFIAGSLWMFMVVSFVHGRIVRIVRTC
jgi:hypothetical protein